MMCKLGKGSCMLPSVCIVRVMKIEGSLYSLVY